VVVVDDGRRKNPSLTRLRSFPFHRASHTQTIGVASMVSIPHSLGLSRFPLWTRSCSLDAVALTISFLQRMPPVKVSTSNPATLRIDLLNLETAVRKANLMCAS
jgi:hypothetical protein